MNEKFFEGALACIATGFTIVFCVFVIPSPNAAPNIIAAFAAGSVDLFAAGSSIDVILCWAVLAILITYEAMIFSVGHAWICLVIGIAPGVALGCPLYLHTTHKAYPAEGGQQNDDGH